MIWFSRCGGRIEGLTLLLCSVVMFGPLLGCSALDATENMGTNPCSTDLLSAEPITVGPQWVTIRTQEFRPQWSHSHLELEIETKAGSKWHSKSGLAEGVSTNVQVELVRRGDLRRALREWYAGMTQELAPCGHAFLTLSRAQQGKDTLVLVYDYAPHGPYTSAPFAALRLRSSEPVTCRRIRWVSYGI